MPSPTLRRCALVVLLATTAVTAVPPAGAVTPSGAVAGAAIEAPANYQAQFLCRSQIQPGVAAFRNLVLKAYPGTHSVSEVRGCSPSTTSEHQDGRAWDWGVHASKKKEKATAQDLLRWLLAPDQFGNDFAMARRLGIMYVIWNKRIWRAYSGTWGPYACSGVTDCHQDHVHFSFGWAGAYKKTSYWTGRPAAAMPPPLPVFSSLTEEYRTTARAKDGHVWGAKLLGGALVYSLRATGVWAYGNKAVPRADAACRQGKDGQWRRARVFRISGVWTLSPTIDTGGGCNTADHTYLATLAPLLSDAISFAFADDKPQDNSGSITIRIRRVI